LDGGSAIVYARSRRSCERLARLLRQHGVGAIHYHAGLESSERTAAQEAFIEGRVQTVVATTAFGMGIDKPDIRLVLVYNLPGSLESCVQRAGRAGREGEPTTTVLAWGPADARSLRRFALADVPTVDELRAVYRLLRRTPVVEPEELQLAVGPDRDPRVLVGMLEQAGLVRRTFDAGRALATEVPEPPPDASARIDALLGRSRAVSEARVQRLVAFAESEGCRHAQVAEHFGEELEPPCGACDVCAPESAADSEARTAAPLPEDAGAAIAAAVGRLRWPLGRRGL